MKYMILLFIASALTLTNVQAMDNNQEKSPPDPVVREAMSGKIRRLKQQRLANANAPVLPQWNNKENSEEDEIIDFLQWKAFERKDTDDVYPKKSKSLLQISEQETKEEHKPNRYKSSPQITTNNENKQQQFDSLISENKKKPLNKKESEEENNTNK